MKQESREALVRAALELFAEEGLDGPSLDAICDRAGYSRGAFYVHFASRDELLVAVMEKVGDDYLASLFGGLSDAAHARRGRRLSTAIERFLATVANGAYPLMASAGRPQVRPHQLLDACARSPVVRQRYAALVGGAIDTVAHLVGHDQDERGVRDDVEPEPVASLALALVIGAQTMAEIGVPLDASRVAETVERMLAATDG
jgi:AcrR family transcriptional regulator